MKDWKDYVIFGLILLVLFLAAHSCAVIEYARENTKTEYVPCDFIGPLNEQQIRGCGYKTIIEL